MSSCTRALAIDHTENSRLINTKMKLVAKKLHQIKPVRQRLNRKLKAGEIKGNSLLKFQMALAKISDRLIFYIPKYQKSTAGDIIQP